jgi:gamma-glutamylcyclotransferase (GGCT)/AIG2-like uncharacterized protein YtfP
MAASARHSGPDAAPGGRGSLFVYGSLMFPEVLLALLGRAPDSTAASAAGWRVAALRGRSYPGLVPGPGTASGRLLTGLSPGEWRTLDAFEDDRYELRELSLTDGGRSSAYVWTDERQVSPSDWSPERFATRQLAAFASSCAAWRSDAI